MPIRSSYKHGIPAWVDVASTDAEQAKRFYSALFGWSWIPTPLPEGDTYWVAYLDGQPIAGLTGMTPAMSERGIPSTWFTYVAVDDIDASLAFAVLSGGSILIPAMDVGSAGRMAFVRDTVGTAIGFWHGGDIAGSGLTFEHGAPVWRELHAVDLEAVTSFYTDVFGWSATVTNRPDGSAITMFAVDDEPVAGLAAPSEVELATDWHVYFLVDDVDVAASTVMDLGGSVSSPPNRDEGGSHAAFVDPTGAPFSVFSSPESSAE